MEAGGEGLGARWQGSSCDWGVDRGSRQIYCHGVMLDFLASRGGRQARCLE